MRMSRISHGPGRFFEVPQTIILDRGLPWLACSGNPVQETHSALPVLMLTALDSREDRMQGFATVARITG
jgi:DNA-binding response OmpR family regulator